ncbi:hypothetical protein LIER_42211 [Lithospermum erythrorhizon]|uniref:Zeaxanthin epoxidase n=1 Tax=Lithospermum erythrorhizon TaxID=34254 RepID=A0AAV3RPY0_LITER
MASVMYPNSISSSSSSSSSVYSRIQSPFLLSKYSPAEICHSWYRKYNVKKQENDKVRATKVKASVAESSNPVTKLTETDDKNSKVPQKNLRILVAGGGIGGLVFALAAKRKGFEVVVFERDLSAVRGEGQYRGPIQVQSNALAALEAIDMDVAEQIMAAGCVTGDRINGLVDGISGNWYTKFDTFTPAAEQGLPVTRVISRMTLQQILACAVGEESIRNDSNVVSFEDKGDKVVVMLENGQCFEGDLLVGADGIRSKVTRLTYSYVRIFTMRK